MWTEFLTFYFYLSLERTAGSCSPLEHSQNSHMQKCCVSRWASSHDVHPTPTFWCQRVPERGIPTKDRSLQRGMPSERSVSLWRYSVWHLLPCHGRKQSSSTHLSRGSHWALHVFTCLHTSSNLMITTCSTGLNDWM